MWAIQDGQAMLTSGKTVASTIELPSSVRLARATLGDGPHLAGEYRAVGGGPEGDLAPPLKPGVGRWRCLAFGSLRIANEPEQVRQIGRRQQFGEIAGHQRTG